MPLANAFVREPKPLREQPCYPLEVAFCPRCGLSQLIHTVPPTQLFRDYVYLSSTSVAIREHAHWLADTLTARAGLTRDDLVVEIASNDGCVLTAFQSRGCRTLGVEPARNIAAIARERGIETIEEFFDSSLVPVIRGEFGAPRLVLARHVLAHVPAIRDFAEGLRGLISDDGIGVVEVPYVVPMIEGGEFDTIYHEHVFYFSVTTLDALFRGAGLELFDVQRLPHIHGGSILGFVRKPQGETNGRSEVNTMIDEERAKGFSTLVPYQGFAERTRKLRGGLKDLVEGLRALNRRLAAYGAAAKGNTLLNYCGFGTEHFEFVADRNSLKQGLYTPGASIPVVADDALQTRRPDYVLLLAWNFAAEILRQQEAFRRAGGRFIIPIPRLEMVT